MKLKEFKSLLTFLLLSLILSGCLDNKSSNSATTKTPMLSPGCQGSNTQSCYIVENELRIGSGTQTRTCNKGSWSSWGRCGLEVCNSGYTLSENRCVPKTCSGSNTQTCNITLNGTVVGTGTQSRSCNLGTWSSFGSCQAQTCNSGYVLSNNQCVAATCSGSNTQTCNITLNGTVVGTGTQSRSCNLGTWSSFGSCQAQTCNSGYTLSNGVCISSYPSSSDKIVRFKNMRSHGRSQFSHASVPFKKGEVLNEAELYNWGPASNEIQWKALKWHFEDGQKHSVAIGGLKLKVALQPNEEKFITISQQPPQVLPISYFQLGPNISTLLNGNLLSSNLSTLMRVEIKLAGDNNIYTANAFEALRVAQDGPIQKALIFRSLVPGTQLSITSTIDIYHAQDFGEMVFQVGNNNFENPNPGHVQIEYADIVYQLPFKFSVRKRGAYGISAPVSLANNHEKVRLFTNALLHEGTSRSFRGSWSAILSTQNNTIEQSSSIAQLYDPLFGVADRDSWNEAKSAGIVGTIIPLRDTVQATRQVVENIYTPDYSVRPSDNSPILNKNPSITGDQPDFSSNMPAIQQYAIQTGSGQLLQYLLHGSTSEENRPTYMYFNNRRMRHSDTPRTCFWWGGVVHFYEPHNLGTCNEWLSRRGLNYSANNGWIGYDDQHFGSPHTRALYEMTGDSWTRDILEYRMSYALWNKLGENFTQVFNRIGSERSTRLMEDALQIYLLMPDAHESSYLMQRLIVASNSFVNGTQNPSYPWPHMGWKENLNTYGVAIIEKVFNDNRYSECVGVNSTTGLDNICGVTWMSGFHLGYHATMYRHGFETSLSKETIHAYMDSRDFYYRADGSNYKARRFYDLNYAPLLSQSFTQSWFSGWMMAVQEAGQDHSDKDWFNDTFLPYMYNNAYPLFNDGVRSSHDKWYQ